MYIRHVSSTIPQYKLSLKNCAWEEHWNAIVKYLHITRDNSLCILDTQLRGVHVHTPSIKGLAAWRRKETTVGVTVLGGIGEWVRLFMVKLCLLVNECQSTILQHNFFFEELCSGRTLECDS